MSYGECAEQAAASGRAVGRVDMWRGRGRGRRGREGDDEGRCPVRCGKSGLISSGSILAHGSVTVAN